MYTQVATYSPIVDSPLPEFAKNVYTNNCVTASIQVFDTTTPVLNGSQPAFSTFVNVSNYIEVFALIEKGFTVTSCMSNCSNNGMCVFKGSQTYGCSCNTFYIGEFCQTDKRPCSSVSCLNNGTCSELKSSNGDYNFTCDCLEYFSESRCELFDMDSLCKNTNYEHGLCMIDSKTSQANCSCFPNYNGTRCEIPLPLKQVVAAVTYTSSISSCLHLLLLCHDDRFGCNEPLLQKESDSW
jgi:hypothetical protein